MAISFKFGGIILPVGVPPGGAVGMVLTKASSDDYDIDWEAGGGGGGGMTPAQVASIVGSMMGAAFAFIEDPDPEPPLVIAPERGPAGPTGNTGRQGDPVVLQAEDPDDTLVIPGERGAQGATGREGLTVVLQPEDPDDFTPMPGERGPQGIPGISPAPIVLQAEDPDDVAPMPGERGPQGIPGVSPAPIVLQAEDPDDVSPIPGDRGLTGLRGPEGQVIVLQPEDPDDPLVIPGERGAAGSAGGGGTITQKIVVLPFPAKRSHSVTGIVDATMAATDKILVTLAGVPETQENAGDALELLSISAVPGAGVFELRANFLNPVAGAVVINYMRAA